MEWLLIALLPVAFLGGGMVALRGIVLRMRVTLNDFVANGLLSREAAAVLMDVLEGRL